MVWQVLPDDKLELYSQIGLRLIDEFTGSRPLYPVSADLEFQNVAGDWIPVERQPTVTPGGIISFPGLGRSAQVAIQPVLRHRVLLRSDFYRAAYLRNSDGLEFDIHPYDDATPPAVIPTHPQTELLLPSASYGYPSHVRVVKGLVHDMAGEPVANVEVKLGGSERVLTDERGAFALPLRWPAVNAALSLDAVDHRTGHSATISIQLPGDLAQGHLFTIT